MPFNNSVRSRKSRPRPVQSRTIPTNSNLSLKPTSKASKSFRSRQRVLKSNPIQQKNILSFSDEILLKILRNLTSSRDLLRLSRTCSRLRRVTFDQSLWINVDTGRVSLKAIRAILPHLHCETKSITIKGFLKSSENQSKKSVSPYVLRIIREKCPGLEELTLYECDLPYKKIQSDFPISISVLRIINSKVRRETMDDLLPLLTKLKSVDFSGASYWATHNVLTSLSELNQLEELSLVGCFNMGACPAFIDVFDVPCFTKLKRIDVRDTTVHNGERWSCLSCLPAVEELSLGYTSVENAKFISKYYWTRIAGDEDLLHMLERVRVLGSKVRNLSLTYTNVTDATMGELAEVFDLESLDVRGARVTLIGVEVVLTLRPRCKVKWGS